MAARVGTCAAIALLVLFALAASAAAEAPRSCEAWGDNTGCAAGQSDGCNGWCQSQCRGGECKPRGAHHYCHGFC
uniref:Knottin scorpion toxin-like domain-containing protein n=1 Tax=Oryza brachyantha TaxID=4533 RepID=J3MDT1_ORYBR